MKRIGAPMIGGMVSSTVMTLLVLPALNSIWKERSVAEVQGIRNAAPSAVLGTFGARPASAAAPLGSLRA